MKLILVLIAISVNLFGLEIKDRTINSVIVDYNKDVKSDFKLYLSKNGKDFDNDFIVVVTKNGKLSNLKTKTYYKLLFNNEEVKFWTLDNEPEKAKTNVTFRKAKPNCISIKTYLDNADGALLIATLGDKIDYPKDGVEYQVGDFGQNNCKIGNSYVVGEFNPKKDLVLKNLKYGIYKFVLVPSNGRGESINYKTDKLKIRETHPQLAVPVQKECEYFKENVAEIKWNLVEGAKYYEVTVCEDKNCNKKIVEYDGANFSNGLDWKLFLEDEQKKYYWKIKAVGLYNSSEYSELMEIDYNYINSAKK